MEIMDEKTMPAKYGFQPCQIIDYKGLRGDVSDNLPGIAGVGDVTATKLIQQYGDFESIVKAAATMTSKVGQAIIANQEMGRECYHLAKMKTDVKLPFSLNDLRYSGYDFASVNDFCQKYELKQFQNRLPIALKRGGEQTVKVIPKIVSSFAGISLPSEIGVTIDTDEEDYHDSPIEGIAVSDGVRTYYERAEDLGKDVAIQAVLKDGEVRKCVYDGKLIEVALNRLGLSIEGIQFDVLLAAYLLDSSLTGSSKLVYASLGVDLEPGQPEVPSLLETINPQKEAMKSFYALALRSKAEKSLKSVDAYKLFTEIEMPLSRVLAKMEIEGFPLDKGKLKEIGAAFQAKLSQLELEIYDLAGARFNIASPAQVADLLFDQMHLADSKSKSTSVDVLNSLKDKNPIVGKILDYRKYAKLMGTYINGLAPHVKKDGMIHTCFNQAQTTTGRLSSSNPNLQNISTRDEEARMIRKAFHYAESGISMLSLDYGQIELRLLAALSGCQAYIDVFNSDADVHTETAKKIFHTDNVTQLMRRRAKAVNFAIIYGTTVYGLADQIGGTTKEAQDMIRTFYEAYPEVGKYLNSVISDVETKGYVTTMFGRRRYLRDVTDPNYAKREAAKRAALNAPVQGSAADLIKIAMIEIDKLLTEGGYKTKMVLQIHDELIFRIPDEEIEELTPKLKHIMVTAIKLPVKLTVEGSVGKSWFDAKE